MTLVVISTKLLNHELEGSFIDLFHLIQKAGEIPLQLTRGMWYDEEYAVVEICDDYRE